jgi:hypothetical protein
MLGRALKASADLFDMQSEYAAGRRRARAGGTAVAGRHGVFVECSGGMGARPLLSFLHGTTGKLVPPAHRHGRARVSRLTGSVAGSPSINLWKVFFTAADGVVYYF